MAPADATGSPSGSTLPGSAVPQETYTANAPFSSGQLLDVQVPANSIFISTKSVNIVECTAPGGVVPTDPSACDGSTIQGATVRPKADGSIDLVAQHYGAYPVYALPDAVSLGETSGVTCNQTTECVLYIGDDQTDFTQPHYWSQPFYVSPNSDDLGENPGDGTAATNPTLGSASTSSLVATSSSELSNGTATDTLTATLLNGTGQPLSGKTVSLGQGTGHSIISPASVVTNASGSAQFTVTDTTTEAITYTATDTTDGVAITKTATVSFTGPVGSPSGSIIPSSAVPGESFTPNAAFSSGQLIDVQIPANSVFTSNEDINIVECSAPHAVIPTDPSACDGNTIQGSTIKPRTNGSIDLSAQHFGLYQLFATPNSASLQETSSAPKCNLTTECILYIGTNQGDFTQPHFWSQPFYVAANPGDTGENPGDGSVAVSLSVPAAASTLVASSPSVLGNGVASDTITATLVNAASQALPGRTVTLSQGSGHSTISSPTAVTNAQGVATFSVKDATAESVTYAATDSTDAAPLTATAPVVFLGTPTVSIAPTTTPTLSGSVSYTATVTGSAGTPSGTIAVTDSSAQVCQITLSSGTGSCSLTEAASATPYTVNAAYSGDAAYTTGTATTTTDVAGFSPSCSTPTIFTGNSATITAGQPFSFSVASCTNNVKAVITGTGLPKGLKLTNNKNGTATIAGTPSIKDFGVSNATVKVTGTGTTFTAQNFTVTVDNAAQSSRTRARAPRLRVRRPLWP